MTPLASFDSRENLLKWETNWSSKRDVVRVIYDRAAAELRVIGRQHGTNIQKTFTIGQDLKASFEQAQLFVLEQTK